jgi:hypothetical protein
MIDRDKKGYPGPPGSELGVGLQQHPARGLNCTEGFNIPAGRKNMRRPSTIKDSRVGTQNVLSLYRSGPPLMIIYR